MDSTNRFSSCKASTCRVLLFASLMAGCGSRSALDLAVIDPAPDAAAGKAPIGPGPSKPNPVDPPVMVPDPLDEPDPVQPCRPRCAGLACGADDGCGGICSAGDCPDGLHCAGGACACDSSSCAGCCAAGQCVAGSEAAACGSGGAACESCSSGACIDNACWLGPQSVTLFGGSPSWGTYTDVTWVWNGKEWSRHEAAGPAPRSAGGMALLNGRNVIFGGIGTIDERTIGGFGDTYEWDGKTWTKRDVAGPSARWSHEMATLNGRVMLFGGYNVDEHYLSDTWEWDGEQWTKRDVAGPPGRVAHAMAAVGDQIVMFGGQGEEGMLGDTWVWDGDAWSEQHVSPSPSKRTGHVMASTPFNAVLFGGGSSGIGAETWEWDGKAWSQCEVPAPTYRSAVGMASWGAKVLLFGGLRVVGNSHEYFNDTWEWDGSQWTKLDVAGPPRGVTNPLMAGR